MPLVDRFGRTIDYLRISVTDRCDLRCAYCMPENFKDYEIPEHWLSFAEIVRLLSLFSRHGLKRVRLTVDGSLHLCLGQENHLDFRTMMRSGASDDELNSALMRAIANKPEKHDFNEQPGKLMRPMSRTGG